MSNQKLIEQNRKLFDSLVDQEKPLLTEYAALDVTQNPERGYELNAEIKELRRQRREIGSLIGNGDGDREVKA